jgi:signal transduction histidine kinase
MKIICFLSCLLFACFANAQMKAPDFDLKSRYAIDTNSLWKVKDLKGVKFENFDQSRSLDIGYNKESAVWCLFNIKNSSKTTELSTWLCFNNNHIDSLTLYDHNEVKILGDRTANTSPFIETLAFELKLKPGEERAVIVRLKKVTSYLQFTYSLENTAQLTQRAISKIAGVSFLIGMVCLLLIINTILFLLTKHKLYAYYIVYSVLSAVYVLIATNFAKQICFTDFRYFSELRIYVSSLWLVSLGYFLCHFLDLKNSQPIKYKCIHWINQVNLLIIAISLLALLFDKGNEIRYLFILGYLNFLICIITLFWSAFTHLKIKKMAAVYALMAFFPQLIWGVFFILKTFRIIPHDLNEDWLVIISLYEVFLFGYVLSRNYIDIFSKNNELMKAIIVEKEQSLQTVNQVQIRERRNIANLIHDNVGSKIAYVMHLLEMKDTKLAMQSTQELANEIRDISHKILPKSLDSGALASSLNSQIITMNRSLLETEIELFTYDFPERIDEPWIFDLYLISLEIINNALKHGHAASVILELYHYKEAYVFQFTDDGIGFDTKHIVMGFGLENIQKRVEYYGGIFELNSLPGQGTVVQITLPIKSN